MTNTVEDLKQLMSSHPLWDITFVKKNGETRKMIATRDWKFLQENAGEMDYETPTNSPTYDASAIGLVRVWDCNELGWRCIPVGEKLLSIERIE